MSSSTSKYNFFCLLLFAVKCAYVYVLYSGKQYSISMTAAWSPLSNKFKTWLFVNPMVEMPSIWCIRSPGAKKSAAGPNEFNALIIGGYERSVRSMDSNERRKIINKMFVLCVLCEAKQMKKSNDFYFRSLNEIIEFSLKLWILSIENNK